MHQITLFQDKKSKNFLGRGHSPLPRLHPQWGGGHPHTPPLSAPPAPRWSRFRRSLLDASFKAEGPTCVSDFY